MALKAGQAKLKERNTNKKRRFVVNDKPFFFLESIDRLRRCGPSHNLYRAKLFRCARRRFSSNSFSFSSIGSI